MKIKAIETFSVTLPFRFAFGHSLATRAHSTNLFVRVTLDDGTQGYGEGVPRAYVTGENSQDAGALIEQVYAPQLIGLDVSEPALVISALEQTFIELGLTDKPLGASWCAIELAVIDAVARAHKMRVCNWFGPIVSNRIRYGGVVPFGGRKTQMAMLLAYKLAGFKTVKVKVGKSREDDLAKVTLARKIMGPEAILRVDANCAWNIDRTLQAAEDFRPFQVASYEQPVPPDKLEWLQTLTAQIPEQIVADESLCTLAQAEMLASERICSAFNVRISKVGGMLAAQKMVAIADRHGIKCHLGAQVGESGILSAAARVFAACNQPFENYEGSMNGILLRQDVTAENLTVGFGGLGDLSYARKENFGLGFSVAEGTLESWVQEERSASPEPILVVKTI
jgi:L-Ala-D/L-Glu epimerase